MNNLPSQDIKIWMPEFVDGVKRHIKLMEEEEKRLLELAKKLEEKNRRKDKDEELLTISFGGNEYVITIKGV